MNLTIGEKIAMLRKGRNITQTELAEFLFLAPQTVSRWESGGGDPDIALLPKIAAFFGVSIDELFGMTSLKRTEDLVSKYSVLRDDRSFQEAMEYIDSQLQTIDASVKNGADASELERERDQLEAEKAHMWIQQGREAFRRALAIADGFVKRTQGKPEHPWYLRMRLQRDQLCMNTGRGRDLLEERREDFAKCPDAITLLRYVSALGERQDYEAVLSVIKDFSAGELLFPPAQGNLPVWGCLIHAAVRTGNRAFIGQYLPQVLEVCGSEDELDLLMCLLDVYDGEELAGIKRRVYALLSEAHLNEYFEGRIRERIEG